MLSVTFDLQLYMCCAAATGMASLPELAISLQEVDSVTREAILSDEEDFYGQEAGSANDTESDIESDEEADFEPNISQSGMEARAMLASSGRVSRTAGGGAEGVFVPSNDPLYERVSEKLSESCCEANCLSAFSADEVYQFQLNLLEMSKEQKSMCLLGKLHVLSNAGEETSHARQRGSKRQRVTYKYAFDHRSLCKNAFLFIHDIGEKQLKNMLKHLKENGLVPIVHGNVGKMPATVYPFEVVLNCVQFLRNYAQINGLPQPSARRGRADLPPIYLPASQNYKIVHGLYVKASMERDPTQRVMQYRSFVDVWHKCIPEIQFMTPRTDVCSRCEKFRSNIKVATTEHEKVSVTTAFSEHLAQAQEERQFYLDRCNASSMSTTTYAHYTFDFAEQLSLPHHSRQVGPMYFKVGRKVQLFGICNDNTKLQHNYLIDESETIGKDGTKSHGPNAVLSMLDHYFSNHGLKESQCHCHADNCVGQNKNRYVIGYLAWRVITGKHQEITLSFMEVGHTRCLVDGHFGLIKKMYRRLDCDTMQHIEEAVRRSSTNNIPQLYTWEWRNWDHFINSLFKAVTGIRKYHHFKVSSDFPGVVHAKENLTSDVVKIPIFKRGITAAKVCQASPPTVIPAAGLSQERARYLYTQVRPYVTPGFQDITCPPVP